MKYLLILGLLLVTQCDSDDPIACTEEFVYGLNVTVRDAESGQIITENITVTATDDDYEETLMTFPGNDNFFGAGERQGNYIISITGEGYEPFVSEEFTVGADECHVIPLAVEFAIQPL